MASANTRKSLDISDNELYNTPNEALSSFYEQYPKVFDQYSEYYDPCNGLGKISKFLESKGKYVLTSDLVDYNHQHFTQDFLQFNVLPKRVECIVMNPPFTLTEKFVDKALSFGVPLIMFNRMTTIESKARGAKFKSREWCLDTMYQFAGRVSCSKGVTEEYTSNSVAYAWYHFKPHSTQAKLEWIL